MNNINIHRMPLHADLVEIYNKSLVGILNGRGMKALLMDAESMRMVGMTLPQSKALALTVVQFAPLIIDDTKRIDDSRNFTRAICILRPEQTSIDQLCQQITNEMYSNYSIYFTSNPTNEQMQCIAKCDALKESIKVVKVFYFDYFPITQNVFSFNRLYTCGLYKQKHLQSSYDTSIWKRCLNGILSVILKISFTLPTIRYSRGSNVTKEFAQDLQQLLDTDINDIYTSNRYRNTNSTTNDRKCIVFILDRKDDPVTPLLQCWTYQSMIHEHLGIVDNLVDLSNVPGIDNDLKEVVLGQHQDDFFRDKMYLNFGEMGAVIKRCVEEYTASITKKNDIKTIQDMQQFVENYPGFRKNSSQTAKHVAILSELSRQVNVNHLMDASEVEQNLACSYNHSSAINQVTRCLQDTNISFSNKLNIVMLYALRYELDKNNHIQNFTTQLYNLATTNEQRSSIQAISIMLRLYGASSRSYEIFDNRSMWSKVGSILSGGLGGVENVYTRHKPFLSEMLDLFYKNRLRTRDYPCAFSNEERSEFIERTPTIIIFYIGGVTYEETMAAYAFMQSTEYKVEVYIGSTAIINSKEFVEKLIHDHGSDDEFSLL